PRGGARRPSGRRCHARRGDRILPRAGGQCVWCQRTGVRVDPVFSRSGGRETTRVDGGLYGYAGAARLQSLEPLGCRARRSGVVGHGRSRTDRRRRGGETIGFGRRGTGHGNGTLTFVFGGRDGRGIATLGRNPPLADVDRWLRDSNTSASRT